ncbi:MAG: hypothetical protein NC350_00665 [Corallococcus sp.]|nr:hypothetical protein [Corallococcus sp.]
MAFTQLKTPWTDSVGDKPLQEYPRPQFVRDSYINLNGWWQYAITEDKSFPQIADGKILVPFSPETSLSGVGRILKPSEYLHYKVEFDLDKKFNKGVVLLHFGAVDSLCEAYVNGHYAGGHSGGYNAFTLDVTEYVCEGTNELRLTVQDFTDSKYHTYGKQSLKRGGIWYTPQSGIWQTVWLESVAPQYIRSAKITPLFDDNAVQIEFDKQGVDNVTVRVMDDGREIAKADSAENSITVKLPEGIIPWTPENPKLYGLQFISRRDKVTSYFGMRKFSVERGSDGYLRTYLNNKPYFHNGLLDQGYFSDGLYTAPCDEALAYDIVQMKNLGFNMLRKHIKVEPMRWYWHCDRLGMLVWQDMPSGGARQNKWETLYLPYLGNRKIKDGKYRFFGRANAQSRCMYMEELDEMIDQLYSCVSVAVWCVFNEGWGQFDADKVAQWTKNKDSTRLVDHASGWHDQGGGDFNSLHVYFKKVKLPKDKSRAVVLSEFGGYSYSEDGHNFNPDKTFGYKKLPDRRQFSEAVKSLYERDVIPYISKGLTAAVYTQVSDVEDEINGLVTYDRQVLKIDGDIMRGINRKVKL